MARVTPQTRSGRVSMVLPLALLAVVGGLSARGMQERALVEGFGWIDPAELRFSGLANWVDRRWEDELAETLGSVPPFRADDTATLALLRDSIAALAFVREVRAVEVIWPDGLRLDLALRAPVACVPVGDHFRTVSADGTLLPGLWPRPPRLGSMWLPVIGPMSDAEGLFAHSRAGDYLFEDEHIAALDVALALREHLGDEELAVLGRVVIDASRFAAASVEEPGIYLELEGRRTVLFGREPLTGEPGELPVALKLDALRRGLGLLAAGDPADDWDLIDVRWDQPEIAYRAPRLAAVASFDAGAGWPAGTRAH